MPIELTAPEKDLYAGACEYGAAMFLPKAAKWDEDEVFPLEEFKRAGKDGYLGIGVRKSAGGRECNFLESALIYQALSRSCFPLVFSIACHNNMSYEMDVLDTHPSIKSLIPSFLKGDEILAFALTEEQAGSDPLSSRTYAVKEEGGYKINGKKTWITNGSTASKIFLTVKLGSPESRQMISFLVDNPCPGLSVIKENKTMGARLLSLADMEFKNCIVPEERVISLEGYKTALWAVMIGRIFVAAMALGICEEALKITAEFLASREQFGKVLIKNQGIQWDLAGMAARLEAAKWLTYRTASLMDSKETPAQESSMAKLVCADLAAEITSRCVQLFGARGYSRDYPIERFYREAKMLQIIDGTDEIQKLVIGKHIADEYLKHPAI